MGRISKNDRALQLQHEESGEPLYANRIRVYPKAVDGPVRRIKWAILIVCLSLYYLMPWLRWDRGPGRANQAVLLDIAHERFYFFDLVLWPQDIFYLTGLLIMGAVTLFLVTSLAGRLWCGYTCPQTVWTDLFMQVERWVEGDRNARMKRDAGPVTRDLVLRKVAKHGIWIGIAFWTGGAWIMYYADAPTVTVQFWTGQASATVYFFIFLFTATTYLLAGWAREQVCTYMCPWPRFQAAMLDEHSFTTTYQAWRGEPRSRGKRGVPAPISMSTPLEMQDRRGDCIDCGACVAVCPTGIDIRNGIQLGCINCGLCIDACNHVMERTGQPKDLITWDTLSRQADKARGVHNKVVLLRTRTLLYAAALIIAGGAMVTALAMRPTISLSVQHDRAPLFVLLADGSYRNGYLIRIVNKTWSESRFELEAIGLTDALMSIAEDPAPPAARLVLPVAADSVGSFRLLVSGESATAEDGTHPFDLRLRDPNTGEATVYHTVFMRPPTAKGK